MKPIVFTLALTTLAAVPLAHSEGTLPEADEPSTKRVVVVQASDVAWTYLNPKRGNLAPMAGTLWGDRNGEGPTGFLLKPADGFESPPHIHNVSYRGVVISGLIHNDDPDAADMWMPTGSFWTQPKGEEHITAARGVDTLAYIEIDEGPYLVLPSKESFDSGERPVNLDTSNIVWLNASDVTWVDQAGLSETAKGPKLAFLWGNIQDGQPGGTFLELPAGYSGTIESQGSHVHAVVIQGQAQFQAQGNTNPTTLAPGSYISWEGASAHSIASTAEEACILYIRTDGRYDVRSVPSK